MQELRGRGVTELSEESLVHQLGAAVLTLFTTSTCGVGQWEPTLAREVRMIDDALSRAFHAVAEWRERDPELFRSLE